MDFIITLVAVIIGWCVCVSLFIVIGARMLPWLMRKKWFVKWYYELICDSMEAIISAEMWIKDEEKRIMDLMSKMF